MTVQTISINSSKILSDNRLSPKVFIINDYLDKFEKKNNFKCIRFGDPEFLHKMTDGEHAGQTFVKQGIKFIKNSDVRDFNIDLSEDFYISEEKHKMLKRSALKDGDILFTTIGHLGSAALVPKNFGEANINQNLVLVRINEKILSKHFFVPYLNSRIVKKQIYAILTGNIHSILTYPKIKSIRIFLPSKSFHKKIVELYEKFIKIEKESNDLISKSIELFYEKFSISEKKQKIFEVNNNLIKNGELWTPKNFFPLYKNTILKIKKNYEGVFLKTEIENIMNGEEPGSKYYTNYLEKDKNDLPFIRTSDLINHQIDLFPDNFIPDNIAKDFVVDLKQGDILFTKDGKIGSTGMIVKEDEDKAILSAGVSRIRLKKNSKITPEYLFLALTVKEIGFYQADRKTVVASTLPHLKESEILNFVIPQLDENTSKKISKLIKNSFEKKNECKILIKDIRKLMDNYYPI